MRASLSGLCTAQMYLYRRGFSRFSSTHYDPKALSNAAVHLTNVVRGWLDLVWGTGREYVTDAVILLRGHPLYGTNIVCTRVCTGSAKEERHLQQGYWRSHATDH